MEEFARPETGRLLLKVYVQPGASRSELAGLRSEEIGGKTIQRLKIKLRARPVDGEANSALIDFLAALCHCPKSSITLNSGHSSRAKTLCIETQDSRVLREEIARRLSVSG
ncbi:MAG: DUF167 domain-containing protein [Cyanobacteria bacterium REEB67]|nr:DUF167 domain-containing protein [Cyanobacteria bacterium REEB67]